MRIDIITVLPEMLDGPINTSILKRAQDRGIVEFAVHNLRDYTLDKHNRVDDYPYGGYGGFGNGCGGFGNGYGCGGGWWWWIILIFLFGGCCW